MIFETESRRLGLELPKHGPFSVRVDMQANMPAGSYMVEVVSSDMRLDKIIGSARSVVLRVTATGKSRGSVQLNAAIQLAEL